MKKLATLLAFSLLILLSALSALAQQPSDRYFPETKHHLKSPFLDYWEKNKGAVLLGAPISIPFSFKDIQVQYFQRGRLELREPNRVVMSNLVAELGFTRSPVQRPAGFIEDDNNTFIQATGHRITGSFYDFYKKNGGYSVFGNPLSEFEIDKKTGQIVQYFEHAIFEWQRDAATGNGKVILRDFGLVHAEIAKVPSEVFAPESDTIVDRSGALTLTCSPKEHVVLRGESWNSIAIAFGTDAESLVKLNSRENRLVIREGETILVPCYQDSSSPMQSTVASPPGPLPRLTTSLNIDASPQYFFFSRNQARRIEITVSNDEGRPLPGVSLIVIIHSRIPVDSTLSPQLTGRSDANGHIWYEFHFPANQGIGFFTYSVITSSPDFAGSSAGWFLAY